MQNRSLITLVILLTLCFGGAHCQPNLPKEKADSLWNVWQDETKPDTMRLNAIYRYTWDGYLFSKPDSAFYYAQIQFDMAKEKKEHVYMIDAKNIMGISRYLIGDYSKSINHFKKSLEIAENIKDQKGIANSFGNMGLVYHAKGNLKESIDCYTRSLEIKKKIGDVAGITKSLNNLGGVYSDQGNYAKSIDIFTEVLKIAEKTGDQQDIANVLNNIGIIYTEQGDYNKVIEYYAKCITIYKKIEDKKGLANTLNNIGHIYKIQGEYNQALEQHLRSLKIVEDMGNKSEIASSYVYIGNIFKAQDKNNKAADYYAKSLKIYEEIGKQEGITTSLNNIGNIYREQGNYIKALEYSQRALKIAQDIGIITQTKNAAYSLWQAQKKMGRHKEALKMYELYIDTRDSIQSEENQKEIIRQEYKYQYEKQASIDSVTYAKEQKLAEATIAQQDAEAEKKDAEIRAKRNQQYALFGGLGLLVVFGGFMYNRYRITQKQKSVIEKQKDEVEHQKDVIEEAHKEITDSIAYAKRIQSAILPPKKLVKEYMPESFILYKPKDVVAGDFYWMQHKDNKVFFAAADCTGHGVPGAMVSVVCNSGLNRSVREYGLTEPGEILDKTREIVIQEFEKSEEEVKDGMDIALCCLEGNKLKYAGANNPLWIIRRGEVLEVKADKQPIGKFEKAQPYTTHELELGKGDAIYLFSDGFVDQFGGERGKKFKPKALRQLLLSLQDKPMEIQRQLLDDAFESWKGNLEQVDDVCMIGLKV